MAVRAQKDLAKRTVEVERKKLLTTLENNRKKHVQDYEEAKAGYKSVLLKKIDEAFEKAKVDMQKLYEKTRKQISEFTDEDISQQSDYFQLVQSANVEMKVPRSYVEDYDMAIQMISWDVNDTVTLSHAEFTCFVLDQWDWKSGFEAVSAIYKGGLK